MNNILRKSTQSVENTFTESIKDWWEAVKESETPIDKIAGIFMAPIIIPACAVTRKIEDYIESKKPFKQSWDAIKTDYIKLCNHIHSKMKDDEIFFKKQQKMIKVSDYIKGLESLCDRYSTFLKIEYPYGKNTEDYIKAITNAIGGNGLPKPVVPQATQMTVEQSEFLNPSKLDAMFSLIKKVEDYASKIENYFDKLTDNYSEESEKEFTEALKKLGLDSIEKEYKRSVSTFTPIKQFPKLVEFICKHTGDTSIKDNYKKKNSAPKQDDEFGDFNDDFNFESLNMSYEELKAKRDEGKLSTNHKSKCGEYLYHGTHRNLDIKSLGIHVCKNRANTNIKAPCVYMTRSYGVACLNCVPFMIGHGSKLNNYEEHFVNLEEAINSDSLVKHVEIVHNDPNLAECSGEHEGYIYCVKKEDCIDDLYYATPEKKNDWYFVAYKQLKIAKKEKIKVTWHKKYDPNFAKKVEKGFMAVESLYHEYSWEEKLPEYIEPEIEGELKPMDMTKYYTKEKQQQKDNLAIGKIDGKKINPDIVVELFKYEEYFECLRHWLTIPDYTLETQLIEFGAIIDRIYGFNKPITGYRGLKVNVETTKTQNSMGLTEIVDGVSVPKDGVVDGYKFLYTSSTPMSISRSVWISKVYGDLIVKTKIDPSIKKLVMTNEIAFIFQKLEEKYPDYRPINLSSRTEIIVFSKQTFKFEVVTTCGDISSEIPELNDIEKYYSSSEALKPEDKKKLKQNIIDYICNICDLIDPSKLNSSRYHRILDNMSDKEFDQWMTYIRDGKWKLHIVAPNMIVNLQNENILKAADACNCKLFHRIWMNDKLTGRKYLTDNEYLILQLPVRRQQQFLDEKMSVPDDDRHIDGMTGQVTGDSKSCQTTNPEIQILASRGLHAVLEEFCNVRGGNVVAYSELKRQAEETGEISLNTMDPNSRSRTAVVAQVLLNSMMLETNIL